VTDNFKKRYLVVDVFTETLFQGNALAVFPDASGIDTETMQKIAKELNLSETTFVFPALRSDCAAKVRIFTPEQEMEYEIDTFSLNKKLNYSGFFPYR
jgi:trans-2,3-dihydro-3-hydroxyanthranilate isomerase